MAALNSLITAPYGDPHSPHTFHLKLNQSYRIDSATRSGQLINPNCCQQMFSVKIHTFTVCAEEAKKHFTLIWACERGRTDI